MTRKPLFAIDFDGVICDSAVETAKTAWTVAQRIWPDMQGQVMTDQELDQFRIVRPHLEFGYEAILIMRLLKQAVTVSELSNNYHQQLQSLIESEGLDVNFLQAQFGQTRDHQIEQDRAAWIASNPLFSGIAEKLKTLHQEDWTIITTKQERFVRHILQGNDIQLDEARIFGLDRKLGKQAILKRLQVMHPDRAIIFIEDRLPTLLGVLGNTELQTVQLQLADWGYNTPDERILAQRQGIEVIGMDDFLRVSETDLHMMGS